MVIAGATRRAGVKRKTDTEWLHGYLAKLDKMAGTMEPSCSDVEYDHHTALKVVAMGYYAEPFSKIADVQIKQGQCDGAVLVDLFAGPGLVRIKGTKSVRVPGSVCYAASISKFAGIVCVEKDKKRHAVLSERLRKIAPDARIEVISGDCNKKIEDVVSWIDTNFKRPMVLTLVDPEGLEINGRTLKRLSDRFERCDFIVNVSGHGSHRVAGAVKNEGDGDAKRLEEYYMNNDIRDILKKLDEGSAADLYRAMVIENLGRSVGSSIRVEGKDGRLAYYLLGYTRKTQHGSQYVEILKDLKSRVEGLDADSVRKEFKKIRGELSSMDRFLPRQSRLEEGEA